MKIHEEWHVTVEGDPLRWHSLCGSLGLKPLWIELNTFERQLMCASSWDPRVTNPRGHVIIEAAGFKIVRVKHEIQPCVRKIDITTAGHYHPIYHTEQVPDPKSVIYYECHVKFNGPFTPSLPLTSRDLFRQDRWYITHRQRTPFNAMAFVSLVHNQLVVEGVPFEHAGHEYEAAVYDSNSDLDASWLRHADMQRPFDWERTLEG